jgi:phosphate transport system permease protein
VVIPYSASGITAGAILGIGRAIGETIAVLMVTGNAAVIPAPLETIPYCRGIRWLKRRIAL